MASRRNYFFRQKVQEDELDAGFALLEEAQWNYAIDTGMFGIVDGLEVSERSGTPNLTVDVAKGVAYDQLGRRVAQPALSENVDVSQDSNSSSTTVSSGGNEKWVSVFIVFDRLLDDIREDGNGDPIYFVEDEAYDFVVMQGAEAAIGAAVRPSLLSNGVLLADIRRLNGQTQIFNAEIYTDRTEEAFVVTGTPLEIRRKAVLPAISDIVAAYNGHLDGSGDQHVAFDVLYGGGAAWLDGTTNPAGTMEDTLDNIILGLKSTSSGTSGSQKLGSASIVGSLSTIPSGTIHSQLLAMKAATAIEWAGGPTWASGESNSAQSVSSALSNIITLLASTSATSGLDRVGSRARTTWLGGRTNPAATAYAALDKIITDLAAQTSNDDGMERVGGQAVSGSPDSLSAGSARSQVDDLLVLVNARGRIASNETITGIWSFSNGDIHVPRIAPGFADLGTLTDGGHLTLAANVGVVWLRTPGTNSSYVTIVLPTPADVTKNPIIMFTMFLNFGFTSKVYFVAPAEGGTGSYGLPPTDYYGFFIGGSANSGYLYFCWDGSKWRHILTLGNNVSTTGGGAYA